MPLDADQLDAFWAVAQTGGFSRAADTLFITQSAVTQRIRALEAALGAPVFVRAGRGVALTPAGQLLVRHCRALREAEKSLIAQVQGHEGGWAGRLAVASGSAIGRTCVLPAAAELARAHPELDLVVTLGEELDAVALLERCQVDAVVGEVAVRRRGIRSVRLGDLAFVLVARPDLAPDWGDRPSGEQLRAHRAIDFSATDRVTLDHLALCLPEDDFSSLRRHFVDDDFGILDWVLAGAGFSVLPRLLVAEHLAAGRLRCYHPEVVSRRAIAVSVVEGAMRGALEALTKLLSARMA